MLNQPTDPQQEEKVAQNTDHELWRERDDYYANSIHVTAGGGIGINCGGTVYVQPLKAWHQAMADLQQLRERHEAEPDVVRMVHGVPSRVHGRWLSDRVAALGNAVVPAQVEWIGRRILDAEAATVNGR